jgi:hypothetical protein
MALFGELSLEETMDLSQDRLLPELEHEFLEQLRNYQLLKKALLQMELLGNTVREM